MLFVNEGMKKKYRGQQNNEVIINLIMIMYK